jgi:tetratricopeptide (TPR) repeat protein
MVIIVFFFIFQNKEHMDAKKIGYMPPGEVYETTVRNCGAIGMGSTTDYWGTCKTSLRPYLLPTEDRIDRTQDVNIWKTDAIGQPAQVVKNSVVGEYYNDMEAISDADVLTYENILSHHDDYDAFYKLGHYYYKNKNYDKMMEMYTPIINAWQLVFKNETWSAIKYHVKYLYNLAQRDIALTEKKQINCADTMNCIYGPILNS